MHILSFCLSSFYQEVIIIFLRFMMWSSTFRIQHFNLHKATIPCSGECSWSAQHGYSRLTMATTLGEKTYTSCRRSGSLSLHELPSADSHLLGLLSVTSLRSNLCRALTIQNATANNLIIPHAQATTALRPDVFLNWIHQLLVRVKGLSAFASQMNCQGKLQTSQSVSVP